MDSKHAAGSLEALGNETRLSIFRLLVAAGLSGANQLIMVIVAK